MKKSQARKEIQSIIEPFTVFNTDNEGLTEMILIKLEQLGMLPPEVEYTVYREIPGLHYIDYKHEWDQE